MDDQTRNHQISRLEDLARLALSLRNAATEVVRGCTVLLNTVNSEIMRSKQAGLFDGIDEAGPVKGPHGVH